MALNLVSISGDLKLSAFWRDGTSLASLRRRFGANSIPALDLSVSYGTGSGQVSWVYFTTGSLAATTAANVDLSGSVTDGLGNTVSATKLKILIVAVTSPDGSKRIRVGPRGVANAAQLNFGGVASTDYIDVYDWCPVVLETTTGFTITAGTGDIVGVYNPGGSAVTYSLLAAGV